MAGVPLEVKVQGRGFKWQPRTWQSIPCLRDKAAQFPHEDSSGHPPWEQLHGGGRKVLTVSEAPRAAPHLGKQFKARQPPRDGEGFATAPSPECPATHELAIRGTSWLQGLCRWEAERPLGDTDLAPIFPLVSEALDPFPKWRGGKIKKPPLFPRTALWGKRACTDPAPTQTMGETAPFD